MHPACCSVTVVEVKGQGDIDTEDVDILNVEYCNAEAELEKLEALNFLRIARLKV